MPPNSSPIDAERTSAEPAHARSVQLSAMISSTALDLPEHRAAVKEACLSADFFPIGMEHLPARDAGGITVSLEMVDKADIYLGIYAWRYGWVPDGKDISVTEMEFDRAVERKADGKLREILIFTAHKKHPVTIDDIETGDIPQQKLTAFKTKAATGRVRKEFKSVEELRRLVSDALHEFRLREHETLRHSSSDIRPSSTLPRLPRFFGRDAELAKLLPALLPDAPGWGTLIDGPGGMGKTTLAVRAAELAAPGHYDGIIFLTAKQRVLDEDGLGDQSGFAVSGWAQMLDLIARRLKRPEIAQAPETERAALLCAALTGARTLLVLDNLESLTEPDQKSLFVFLKQLPRDCKALLTSRTLVTKSGGRLPLDPLDQGNALKLLKAIAQDNPRLATSGKPERIRLYTETGGNPLLLCWTAWQVGTGDRTTIGDALDHLRSCPPGEDPLGFIFGDMLASLSDAQIRIAAALSYPAQSIPVAAIAEISGVPEADTQRWLKALTNRSIVVPHQEEKEYTLVPMVADFLRKKKPEVVAETGDRLEKRAYALIIENGYRKHDRFPALEAAWPGIAPALALFLAGDNARLQTVCNALPFFLEFQGRWDEGLALNEKARARAVDAADHHQAGWRAYHTGCIHYLRQQADDVLKCADRAEEYWAPAKKGDLESAMVIRLRGISLRLKREYRGAITAFRKSLDLCRSLAAESVDMAIALSDLANAENDLANAEKDARDLDAADGHFHEAKEHFREGLRVAGNVRYAEGVACMTGDLAELALDREDWPAAETLAREALPLSEAVHRQELIARDNRVLAHALVRQGKAAEALPHAQRAVEIYTDLSHPDLADAQATLAECGQALAAK